MGRNLTGARKIFVTKNCDGIFRGVDEKSRDESRGGSVEKGFSLAGRGRVFQDES